MDEPRSNKLDTQSELLAPGDLSPWSHLGAQVADDEIDTRRIVRTLWRQKKLILGTIVLITGLATWWVFEVPRTYTAQTMVVLGPQKANLGDIQDLVPDIGLGLRRIQTEVETLETEQLAETVVDKLGLIGDPEFNPNLPRSKPSLIRQIQMGQDPAKKFQR